jgi:hypothetical protein
MDAAETARVKARADLADKVAAEAAPVGKAVPVMEVDAPAPAEDAREEVVRVVDVPEDAPAQAAAVPVEAAQVEADVEAAADAAHPVDRIIKKARSICSGLF